MSIYRGSIRNVRVGRGLADLHVFERGLILGPPDLKGLMAKVVAGTSGSFLIGQAADQVADSLDRKRTLEIAAQTFDALAKTPGNRVIEWSDIKTVTVSHPGIFSSPRIDLDFVDGHAERFEWRRLHNDPKEIAALLRPILAERLVVGKGAG